VRSNFYAHCEQHGPGHESDSRAIFLYNQFMPDLNNLISLIQSSQRTLFILCGFPYAGKSYIAEQLLEHTDLKYVSIDSIFHIYGFDWDLNTLPDAKAWEQIFTESYEQTKQALVKGMNVLYDSTNQTVASRDKLREVARSVSADTKVVYVKSSIENVWKRWEKNQVSPSRSVVDKNLVQMTIDMFEDPATDENVVVIDNS
jgi:predicted kinase